MRKLMRSISPFSKKNVTIDDPGPSVPLTNDYHSSPSSNSTTKPTWSVEGINFLQFLQIFYERYNPEKLSSIDFIYKEYQGEEMVLIFELAEKYNLSHEAMQKILNTTKTSPGQGQGQGQGQTGQLQVDTMTISHSKSGPPSSSSQGSSLNPSQSLVTPNWQTRRSTDRSSSARNISPYLSSSATNSRQDQQQQQQMTEMRAQRDESGQTRSAAPMTLQDIIQTTRQNDLLAKKSVRFSMTNPETEQDLVSEGNSSQSLSVTTPSPASSSALLTTKRVSNFGSSSQPPSNQILQHLQTPPTSTPTLTNNPPLRSNSSYPSLQNPSSGASSLQARIRSSLGTPSSQETQNNDRLPITDSPLQHSSSSPSLSPSHDQQSEAGSSLSSAFNGLSYPRGALVGKVKVLDQQIFPSASYETQTAAVTSATATATAAAASRMTELEDALKTTQLHLHALETEKEDLLKIFEDSWGSPQQILKVVCNYLEKHGRTVDIQTDDGQSSIQSSFSTNPTMKMEDLEGRKTYRDMNPYMKGQQEKPYMLGTASSVKRGMEAALGTNSVPSSRDSSPIPSSARGLSPAPRGLNPGSQGRWIRPSSADTSQRSNRSSSPASSITDVSSRYRGYTPPTREHSPAALDSQYQSTRQRLRQETNQEKQNHDLDRSKYDKNSKLFEREQNKVTRQLNQNTSISPARHNGQSPKRGAAQSHGEVDDWVTCIDPKTQRKYYYSKSRKVSSWTLPTDTTTGGSSSSSWSPSSRSLTNGNNSRGSTPTNSRPNSRERNPQRAPSPTGSLTSLSSQNTRERSGSNSSSIAIGGGWFEAIDPQSGRTYWFNRTTKQSTWKRPTDLTE